MANPFKRQLQNSVFPSMITSIEKLKLVLAWSTRVYSIYSLCLASVIQTLFYLQIDTNAEWFIIPFMIQAAILFYTLQAYRRFFVLSPTILRNIAFRMLFFIWLIIFLLFNIYVIIFAGIPTEYSHYISFFALLLSFKGEWLVRRMG